MLDLALHTILRSRRVTPQRRDTGAAVRQVVAGGDPGSSSASSTSRHLEALGSHTYQLDSPVGLGLKLAKIPVKIPQS